MRRPHRDKLNEVVHTGFRSERRSVQCFQVAHLRRQATVDSTRLPGCQTILTSHKGIGTPVAARAQRPHGNH